MIFDIYKHILRLPDFEGKSMLTSQLRKVLRPRKSRVDKGIQMELDPQEWLQVELLESGSLEPKTIELYHDILDTGDTYIDVGAHVGFHALIARRLVGEEG